MIDGVGGRAGWRRGAGVGRMEFEQFVGGASEEGRGVGAAWDQL